MRLIIALTMLIIATACTHTGPYKLYQQPQLTPSKQVELTLPKAVDLLQLDGKELKLPYNPDEMRHFYLLPGEHKLIVRYDTLWNDDMGNHEVVDSKLLGFHINAQAGEKYQLHTLLPTNLSDAKAFVKNIQLELKNNHGQLIKSERLADADQSIGPLETLLNDKGSAYDHLTTWWQEATDSEKALFKQYIENNP